MKEVIPRISINGEGALRVTATGVGKDSYLNKVINLVQDAQAAKSNWKRISSETKLRSDSNLTLLFSMTFLENNRFHTE